MLTLHLPEELERRLAALAERSGHSPDAHVEAALRLYLDDAEDGQCAAERLQDALPAIPLEEVERGLGLAD
ncbi:MAG: ribbon-helix-helix protein, CopG family [Geminicoccaceae bacterium]